MEQNSLERIKEQAFFNKDLSTSDESRKVNAFKNIFLLIFLLIKNCL
jgi:hypothetical protein